MHGHAEGGLEEFRRGKDHFFAHDEGSPLSHHQRHEFSGLTYFPPNPSLQIDAALEEPGDREPLTVQTSTGDTQTYRRAGLVRFRVDGQDAQLTLFTSDDGGGGHGLFLPFRDQTSGAETYGAGRYLDVDPPRDARVRLDFNYAYSPSCAYNEQWSCPLPPVENWLRVPIRAGEKTFAGGHGHDEAAPSEGVSGR